MIRTLSVLLVLALGMRLAFFAGLRGSDDLQYAELAKSYTEGDSLMPDSTERGAYVSVRRPAFTGGIAASIRTAGAVSEAALMAYPMICSLALVAALYLAACAWVGPAAGFATGLIAASLPGFVLGGSSLYPDLPMTLWTVVSLSLLWGAPGWGGLARPASCAAGAALALAAHHKETAFLLLPVLGCLALTRSRRALAAWILVGLAAGICFGWGGYLINKSTSYLHGQVRLQQTEAPERLAPALNPTMGTTSSMPRRLLWDFTGPLVDPRRPGVFAMWAGVAWLALGGAWLAFRERSRPLLACTAWAFLAFLALDFAGLPGRGYTPVHPVSPRYLVLVMPPLVLLAGAFCAWAWARLPRPARWGAGGLVLAAVLAFNWMTAAPNRAYSRALDLALSALESEGAREVWTDRRTVGGLRLFLPSSIKIHEITAEDPLPERGLIVANGPVLEYLTGEYGDAMPTWLSHPPPAWVPMAGRQVSGIPGKGAHDPRRRVTVYRAGPTPGLLAVAGLSSPGFGITFRQRVVVTVMSLGLVVFIFELVRRRRLREEYSWLWMLSAGVIGLFALYHPALLWVTHLIGAGLPTSTLFLFGLLFLILISIHYAVKISTLTMQIKNLHQELAMLKDRLSRGEAPGGPPDVP